MSKSEGNFITVHDLLHTTKFGGRKWTGEVLRLAMLMTHYREPLDFTVRRLEEAERLLARWHRYIDEKSRPSEAHYGERPRFARALGDDVDTVAAVALIAGYCVWTESIGFYVGAGDSLTEVGEGARASVMADALRLLGLPTGGTASDISTDQAVRIDTRSGHLANRNFAEADRIRDELAAEGIHLMDYKDPETGERRTKWEVRR